MVAARLFFPAVALFAATLHSQEVRTVATNDPEVTGIVKDAGGVPIPDVEVGIIRGERLQQFVTTAADGKFLLTGVASGVVPLRIRRLGYAIQFLDVDTRTPGARTVEIVLKTVASELDEVTVAAGEGRLRGFYDRRERRGSFGRFLVQDEIQRHGARFSSDLFRSVPGITVGAGSGGGNTIRIRGCQPMVWLDGQRVFGAELDEVVQPGEIAAIEFYPSNAGVPAQFMERGNRLCGAVLVWTRNQ
ncbi:MAG: TonB-dependent receptor [Gemmatimonadota bacterium]|nr:TonB-dependent receptor [Gemmatimonadota bacterium]